MVRTPRCDKSGLKKGTWTPEEDRKLIAYVTRYGHWNWRLVPKFAGLARCGKSCRLRWMNYLRPNIKRGNFTLQEEDTIIKLHAKLGNRWSKIAAELPGRSDNEIKNHWHSNLKKRLPQTTVANESAQVVEPKDKCPLEPVAYDSTALWSITGMAGAAGDSALLEEYTEPVTPDFWTELYSYVVDISFFPGELVAPTSLNEPEILSPVYDAQLWGLTPYDQYEY